MNDDFHQSTEADPEVLPQDQDLQRSGSYPLKPLYNLAYLFSFAIVVASLVISGSLFYLTQKVIIPRIDSIIANQTGQNFIASPQSPGPAQLENNSGPVKVSVDDDPVLGNMNAPVTLVEFSDFQCPFCRKFWKDTLPEIKKSYIDTGKVKLVYRDFPLEFHAGAKPAAEATECAREQNKFWELHDKIFQEQEKMGQGTIEFAKAEVVKWAGQIGLNMTQFNACLDSRKYQAEVEKDVTDGSAAGVSGTPTAFIGKVGEDGMMVAVPLVGAQPYAAFKAIIDQQLK